MGFGSTAKKLQKVASLAEDSYKRINELREQLVELREKVDHTSQKVDDVERDLAEQRALLEALADEQGLDIDSIIADANIETVDAESGDESTDSADESDTDSTSNE